MKLSSTNPFYYLLRLVQLERKNYAEEVRVRLKKEKWRNI